MSKVTKKDLNERLLMVETLLGLHRELPEQISVDKANDAIFRMQWAVSRGKEIAERKPQLKQLDQSIFDGLDEKWRFAMISSVGIPFVYDYKPTGMRAFLSDSSAQLMVNLEKVMRIDEYDYDTADWQNSLIERDIAKELVDVDLSSELTGSELCKAMLARGDKCVLIRMGVRDDKQAKDIGRFAIATSIDESGRFNVMSDQQPISKVDFAVPINNQGEPLTAAEAGF